MKSIIVVNPSSGGGRVGARWGELEKSVFDALGEKRVPVVFTSSYDHGSGIVKSALEDGARKIIAVGGDGTLSEVIQGFFKNEQPIARDAILACLPAGRGDDFFKMICGKKHTSHEDAWQSALHVLKTGKAKQTDTVATEFTGRTGLITRRYFLNLTSFGIPGLVTQRVVERIGLLAKTPIGTTKYSYPLQSALSYFLYKPIDVTICVDEKLFFEGPLFMGVLMNGRYNGGGMCWSNDALIDDGLLSLTVIEPMDIFSAIATSKRMKSGEWVNEDKIRITKAKSVDIRINTPGLSHPFAEIDGDLPEPADLRNVKFSISPSSLLVWR